jgi:hypothetical protein
MFTFYFNQSGDARKPFVKAVSEILEARPKYLGMPSAAYEIDVFTVTKEGNIELDERTDSELVENLIDRLAERGYEAEPVEGWDEDEQPITAQPTEETKAAEETETANALPTDDQGLIDDAEDTDEDIATTISMPRGILSDSGLENLKKLVWAKGELLCQAFNIESTEIEVNDEAINFPWFGKLEPEELKYAAQFISGLCKFANDSRRITSKPHSEGNPKFAMRVWAIRMGFSGAEHKDLRKFLLRNLPGDAAFRFGRSVAQENTAGEGEVEDDE